MSTTRSPASSADQLFGGLRNLVEVLGHRAVDAAAVPVRVVEDRAGHRVPGLYQPAGVLIARHVAANELERYCPLDGLLTARLGEGARDALLAQVEDGREFARAADAARGPSAQAGRRCTHTGVFASAPYRNVYERPAKWIGRSAGAAFRSAGSATGARP